MAMNINAVTGQNVPVITPTSQRNTATKAGQVETEAAQEKVSLGSEKAEALTYSKPRAMPAELATMLEESDRKVQEFMDYLRPLLEQQGLTAAKVASGEQRLTVDQQTIDAAKQAIGEDGEWGVKKVAERILSFARFAIGDEPGKLQKIRDAVDLGFSQAKEMLGGVLPEISQQTYDTIMAEFDRWEKEGMPESDIVSLAKPAADEGQSDKG